MNPEIPKYGPAPQPKTVDPVARSIAKPDAFAKPGVMKSMRMRALKVQERRRKVKRDPRYVEFY